jgi:hypothetical protein
MEAGTHGRRSDRSGLPTAPAWLLQWLSADAERIDREERYEEPGFKRQGKYASEADTIYCTVLGVMWRHWRVLGAEHSITLLVVLTADNQTT